MKKFLFVMVAVGCLAALWGCDETKNSAPIAGDPPIVQKPGSDVAVATLAAFIKAGHEMTPDPKHRGQHPKGHGCVWAEFAVNVDGLPDDMRIGIFKESRSFKALIRFSNGRTPDDREPDVHGMAIKLFDVEGEKVLPSGQPGSEEKTHDFVLADNPVFFAKNAQHMLDFVKATSGKPPEERAKIVAELAKKDYPRLIGFTKPAASSPFVMSYWSQTPYQLGTRAVKYLGAPKPARDASEGSAPPGDSADFLRTAMVEELTNKQREAVFDFFVQPWVDDETTPVDDATVEWKSTPIKIATITIAPQTFDSAAQMEFCERLSYTPWHCLPVHQPLGSINRARKTIYLESLKTRSGGTSSVEPTGNETFEALPAVTWQDERERRNREHQNYIAGQVESYNWFAHASNGKSGPPFILVRLLPELDPEIWGSPEEDFARFGFFRTSADADRPLPTALAWDTLIAGEEGPKLHGVTLSCGACHIGRVRLIDKDRNGKDAHEDLVGAPNTQADVRKWRRAFELMAAKRLSNPTDIQKTVDEVIKLMDSKEPTFFYREWPGNDRSVEAEQRKIFKAKAPEIIGNLAKQVGVGRYAVDKELQTNYSKSNHPPLEGGTPGQSDGSGDLIPKLLLLEEIAKNPTNQGEAIKNYMATDYEALPKKLATATDNLSTWSQVEHPLAQLDGSVKSPFFRNIAAILAIAGRPDLINVQNAHISGKLIRNLPPPPYPFNVDIESAGRGKKLYKENCAVCHHPNSEEVYSTLGTDPNRAKVLRPKTFDLFLRNFQACVPEDFSYLETKPDGTIANVRPRLLPAEEVLVNRSDPSKQGYLASALEGTWARAPYLHNGAVPTLRHLLAPKNADSARPAKFVRGCVSYDTANVGFVWQIDRLQEYRALDLVSTVYDTSWDGCSNSGHDTDIFVLGKKRKLDWSGEDSRRALQDLVEYLKTL
jgi:hypothetical protein